MRKLIAMLLCVVLAATQLSAQTRTIRGRVLDEKNNPVANASVLVKGTTRGVATGADGNFSISIENNAKTLVVQSVGFATQEVAITSSASYGINLRSASENLEEVVVTGYSREKKSQFVGAASVISSKAVETVPVGSFDQALQGRAPGMLVNSGSGQPGASAAVTIRGVQSIAGAGAQPLYVIDGVPSTAGDFATLNPNDFESLTVLKDAGSAALYGARGGTGVIVITTKRGKAGANTFQYRTQFGFTQKPGFDRLNLMNTAEMLQYEEREQFAGTPGWVYSPLNPALPTGYTAAMKQKSLDSIRAIDTDFTNIFYRQGLSQTHELNMSGGTDKTRYYVSGGYFGQEGIDLYSNLNRYTLRFNLDHTADKLTVALNTSVGYSTSLFSEGELLQNSPLNPFQMTYRAKTYENPYKADGTPNFGTSGQRDLKAVANLLERLANSKRRQSQIKLNGGLTLAYRLLPYLTLRNTFGADVSSTMDIHYINASSYAGSLQTYNSGLGEEASKLESQFINTSSVIFSKRIASVHEIEAGAYFEVVRGWQKGLGFRAFLLDPRLSETTQNIGAIPTAGAATVPQNVASAKSGFGIRSFFGTLRYTYNNRYTLTGNVRRDGTSRILNDDNKEITTWAAGFSWSVLQEKFMDNQKFFSDLKLRANYGIVPNIGSINTANYGTFIGNVTNYLGQQIPGYGTSSYVGSTIVGSAPTGPGNVNLQIEYIQKLNIGVDMAFWNNRARLSVDVYRNKTVDLFISKTLGATTGFGNTGLPVNAGAMSNKGFEVTYSVDVIKSRDVTLTLGGNHSMNTNSIDDLGGVPEYGAGTFIIRAGLPYGSHYTYNYLGVDAATGNPRFETADGKETFDPAKAGLFAKFGTYLPKHQGGFTADLRYKRFTVSALFTYQFDVVRSDNTRNWITRGTSGYQGTVRGSRELLTQQWQKAGDVVAFQKSTFDRGFTSSDLNDAKFLRFRNLNIGYDIPEIRVSGTTIVKNARFYVQGQNLAIWSPWKGLDPEDNNNISLNEYPNPKMFVVGLDIRF